MPAKLKKLNRFLPPPPINFDALNWFGLCFCFGAVIFLKALGVASREASGAEGELMLGNTGSQRACWLKNKPSNPSLELNITGIEVNILIYF